MRCGRLLSAAAAAAAGKGLVRCGRIWGAAAKNGWLVRCGGIWGGGGGSGKEVGTGWYAGEDYCLVGAMRKINGQLQKRGFGALWKIIWTKIVVWSHYQWHLLLCGVEHCMVA